MRVLKWVVDGCPDGWWEDYSYKRTTYALDDRGLVTVDRRRNSWSAQVTDDGRYYLEHRQYRPNPEGGGPRSAAAEQRKNSRVAVELSSVDLIAELQARDGVLTIPDPAPNTRALYRSAISKVISAGAAPEGYLLRHTGRDRGDLVIRLISRYDAGQSEEKLPPIPAPTTLETVDETVRTLRDERPELLDVADSSRQRALLVLQAIADECGRRGYEFNLRPDNAPTFQISVDGVSTGFFMFEEYENRPVVSEDELKEAKYPWQRVRSTVQKVRSGRLAIQTGSRNSPVSWADRKRWSLADRLPDLFAYVEQSTIETIEKRARDERERIERRQAWEQALDRAKQLYVTDLNRRRLDDQLAASRRAEDLRRYADRIDRQADAMDDAEASLQAHHWAAWTKSEADRTDPLHRPADLVYVKPAEDIKDSDLEAFMPRGMSVWRPPPR
ncbi:hypothetical protein [Arthrobacter sp. ISL-30]|uniref:hypothetical protein n=1 Tax=Arthrobacter sp. ISL-30 TaxID=2819109 RepID=UPI001BE9FA6B|nr:hypothetical protein [Arthrobacter sp. ISL-30]MBT2513097.1 hypothetical protein [Arthrobacter sp. ISL-30]